MEDAVEPKLAAVGVAMEVAPSAGITDIEIFDGHRHSARPKPLHEQLWIGIGAEDELARRGELPGDDNLWQSGFCGDLCLCRCHAAFLSDSVPHYFGRSVESFCKAASSVSRRSELSAP